MRGLGARIPRAAARFAYRTFERALPYLPDSLKQWTTDLAARVLVHLGPRLIQIEPINRCNLRCPACPVGSEVLTRPGHRLRRNEFSKILRTLESLPGRPTLVLTGYGEPLMNPELGEMAQESSRRGFEVIIETNGTFDRIEPLLGVEGCHLWVAVDGLNQSSYEVYRQGGNLENVWTTLRSLAEGKRAHDTPWPRVRLQFIVMRHNEHELVSLPERAAELGVDELALKHVQIGDYHDRPREELGSKLWPRDPRFVLDALPGAGKPMLCPQGLAATVLSNGDLVMCCIDYDGEYLLGNLFQGSSLLDLWRSPRGRRLRREALLRRTELCEKCDFTHVHPLVFRRRSKGPAFEGVT